MEMVRKTKTSTGMRSFPVEAFAEADRLLAEAGLINLAGLITRRTGSAWSAGAGDGLRDGAGSSVKTESFGLYGNLVWRIADRAAEGKPPLTAGEVI